MSVETEFRAALLAHAPLAALVAGGVVQDALPEGDLYPIVVYSVRHDRTHGIGNEVLVNQCAIAVQCWAETGAEAEELADAVEAALAAVPAAVAAGAVAVGRTTTYDDDTGLDGTVLEVEWWA